MTALFTALMENEDKASLAGMVCDMWGDRTRLVALEPLVSFSYDVLQALAANEDMHSVGRAAIAAGLIKETEYDPGKHTTYYLAGDDVKPGEVGFELTDAAVAALRLPL